MLVTTEYAAPQPLRSRIRLIRAEPGPGRIWDRPNLGPRHRRVCIARREWHWQSNDKKLRVHKNTWVHRITMTYVSRTIDREQKGKHIEDKERGKGAAGRANETA